MERERGTGKARWRRKRREEIGNIGKRGEREGGPWETENKRTDLREKPEEMGVLPPTFPGRGNDIP